MPLGGSVSDSVLCEERGYSNDLAPRYGPVLIIGLSNGLTISRNG